MTSGPISDPKQWHRSRAWTDAILKGLPPQQAVTLMSALVKLPAPGFGVEPDAAAGTGWLLKIGDLAMQLRAETSASEGALPLSPDCLIASDDSADGRKGVKSLEEWIRAFIAKAPPPARSAPAQADFWDVIPAKKGPRPGRVSASKRGASRRDEPSAGGPGSRRYRLRLDFTVAQPHWGWFAPRGKSFADTLARAAQLQWYVSGSFLNVAERGAYAGRLQGLAAGSSHTSGNVAPRFHAFVELSGGRDRLIQAAMELRRLADSLFSDACLRGEMGLLSDPAPEQTGTPEDVFIWSGSLNWGERLVLGWEQAGWLREVVDFLVEIHRKRGWHEQLLKTLVQASQWAEKGEAGTIRIVALLTDYFDRYGRNRHLPPDMARRLALSLGRNEKFVRHRPYPTKPGWARTDELTALAVRLVRLQCGLKRPARYCRTEHTDNNGAVQTRQAAGS